MKLGEKIKKARKAKGLTQSDISKGKITRNMISRIESGSANPSLGTLKHLADALSLPLPYLLSDDDDLFFYEKQEVIAAIRKAYAAKDYLYCINKQKQLSDTDDELAYITASSAAALCKDCIRRGSLLSAGRYAELAEEYAKRTVYNTDSITAALPIYKAISTNIQAPLLEFSGSSYEKSLSNVFDYELYQYMMQNKDYCYESKALESHIKAKQQIKERDYAAAIKSLLKAVEYNVQESYSAFIQFGIYADLELCYKQLYDFENAYIYSSKRMSMIEGFKS